MYNVCKCVDNSCTQAGFVIQGVAAGQMVCRCYCISAGVLDQHVCICVYICVRLDSVYIRWILAETSIFAIDRGIWVVTAVSGVQL